MKPLVALVALLIATGCNRDGGSNRRSDTSDVTPPVSVSDSSQAGGLETPLRSCGLAGEPVLTEDGIGELRPGRAVADIEQLCTIESDSEQRGAEGMMERMLVVSIAGETVRAVVTNDRIWRVEVTSSRFRTADSLGVDAPLRLIARRQGAQFAPGEDGVYAFVPDHCGLRFRFSLPLRPPSGGQWTAAAINAAHGDAAVDRVLVTRCEH